MPSGPLNISTVKDGITVSSTSLEPGKSINTLPSALRNSPQVKAAATTIGSTPINTAGPLIAKGRPSVPKPLPQAQGVNPTPNLSAVPGENIQQYESRIQGLGVSSPTPGGNKMVQAPPVVTSKNARTQVGKIRETLDAVNAAKAGGSAPIENSLSEQLAASGQPSDFTSRAQLASSLGITGYAGTKDQDARIQQLMATRAANTSTDQNTVPEGAEVYYTSEIGADGKAAYSYFDSDGTQLPGNPMGEEFNDAPGQTGAIPLDGQKTTSKLDAMSADLFNLSDEYQAELHSVNNETDQAYSTFQTNIAEIRNGQVPLTPTQNARLKATEATLEQAKKAQQLANSTYVKGLQTFQARTGNAKAATQTALGDLAGAIAFGQQQIAELDTKGALALADMEQGFTDDNIQQVRDSYKDYTAHMDGKKQVLEAMYNASFKTLSDLRTFTQTQQEANRDEEFRRDQLSFQQQQFDYSKTQDAIENKKPVPIGQDAFGGTIYGTYDAASDSFVPVAGSDSGDTGNVSPALMQAGQVIASQLPAAQAKALQRALQSGDDEQASSLILANAFNTLTAPEAAAARGRVASVDALTDIQGLLDQYKKAGGDTGLLAGNAEQLAQRVGKTGNPELAQIGQQIQVALIAYRNAVSGAAFTEPERKQYEALFPSTGNSPELNAAKIKGLTDAFNRNNRSVLGLAMGGEGVYDSVIDARTKSREDAAGARTGEVIGDSTENNPVSSIVNSDLDNGKKVTQLLDMGDEDVKAAVLAAQSAGGDFDDVFAAAEKAQKKNNTGVGGISTVDIPQSSHLAYVNNNPINLKYAGQKGAVKGEKGFAKFGSAAAGAAAGLAQIALDSGRGLSLAKFILKFAPPTENDTKKYISQVSDWLGISPTTPLAKIDHKELLKALAKKESSSTIA